MEWWGRISPTFAPPDLFMLGLLGIAFRIYYMQ